jgi:muramoyltetrapeptide carboxypeptidase
VELSARHAARRHPRPHRRHGRGHPHEIDGLDTVPLQEIVLDVLGDRDIPVLGNVEFGHAGPNLPMPVGVRVALDAQQRTLSLLEPAVS